MGGGILLSIAFAIVFLIYIFSIIIPSGTGGYNDSAIFQYIGQQVAQGGRLYADIWDHKGPVIFIVNTLGFLMSPHSCIGIHTIILIIVSCSLFAFYKACKMQMPASYAGSATLCLLMFELGILCHPQLNSIENIALLFYCIGLWVFLSVRHRYSQVGIIALGFLVSLAFWTKANLIGFGIFLPTYWILSYCSKEITFRQVLKNVCLLGIGFIIPSFFICLYFAIQGTLTHLIDASFLYNMKEYNQVSFGEFLYNVRNFSINFILQEGPLCLLIISYLGATWKNKAPHALSEWLRSQKLLLSMFIWFMFETLMCCIKGIYYPHYLIMTYPALFFSAFLTLEHLLRKMQYFRIIQIFILSLLLIPASWGFLSNFKKNISSRTFFDDQASTLLALNKELNPVATYGGIATTRILNNCNLSSPQKYCINMFVMGNNISSERKNEIETEFHTALRNNSIHLFISERKKEDIFLDNPAIQKELKKWTLINYKPSNSEERRNDLYYYSKS